MVVSSFFTVHVLIKESIIPCIYVLLNKMGRKLQSSIKQIEITRAFAISYLRYMIDFEIASKDAITHIRIPALKHIRMFLPFRTECVEKDC